MAEPLPSTPPVQASREAARAGRGIVLVLRVLGCVDLLALAAVVMPRVWLARGHAWAGLGELPPGPLVGYLCCSASLLYALHGATVLFVSSDLPRYERLYANGRAYLPREEAAPIREKVARLAREHGVRDRRSVKLEPPQEPQQLALTV